MCVDFAHMMLCIAWHIGYHGMSVYLLVTLQYCIKMANI